MESTIAAQCIEEQDTGLVLDMAGIMLPAASVIMCMIPLVPKGNITLKYIG